PGSKRCIETCALVESLLGLPPFVEPVFLFVNVALQGALRDAEEISKFRTVRTIQWHGDQLVLPPASPWRFIPAFPITVGGAPATSTAYPGGRREGPGWPAAVLLDGHAPGQYGGTGQTAPWQLLADFDPGVPVILAGGLTPENVAEAIRIVRPYAVDVASGVESAPGRKDPDKLKRFIDAVRSV